MGPVNVNNLEKTAQAYDDILVPALFQPFATRIAEAAKPQDGSRILDIGCGTGALTREFAARVGGTSQISGLDANAGMLAIARRREPSIDWRLGDAAALPFDDNVFDIVTNQFALMLFDDRQKSLIEALRVLRAGGMLSVAVFDGLARNRAYRTIADIYEKRVGPQIANALRFPFSLGDIGELRALFGTAGIDQLEIETKSVAARFYSAGDLARADIEGWFPFAGIELSRQDIDNVIEDLRRAMQSHIEADGSIQFEVFAHIVTVTKS